MDGGVDGGRGWLVVVGAFLSHVVVFGIIYSFGVFFTEIVDEFHQGRGATSWIASISSGVMLGTSGLTGRLADRFGGRRLVLAGAGLVSGALLLASLAQNVWQVYLTYGLLGGLGSSCAYIPSVGAVGQWFDRRRGTAIGLAVAGTGVGTMVIAPVAQDLIAAGGWRSALRVLALAALVVLVAAASLLIPAYKGPGVVPADDVRVARDPIFRRLYLASLIGSYGFFVPFIHVVPAAKDSGIPAEQAAQLVALLGMGNMTGRLVLGPLADRVGRLRMLQVATAGMAAATLLWAMVDTMGPLTLFALAYGFFAGAFIALLPALAGDYFGAHRLAGVAGLLFTGSAVGTLLGSPVTGFLFDALGSYTVPIVLAAAAMAVNALLLRTLPAPAPREPTVPQPVLTSTT